eukprot:1161645-Pelagomonas_calceolata.AAC.28
MNPSPGRWSQLHATRAGPVVCFRHFMLGRAQGWPASACTCLNSRHFMLEKASRSPESKMPPLSAMPVAADAAIQAEHLAPVCAMRFAKLVQAKQADAEILAAVLVGENCFSAAATASASAATAAVAAAASSSAAASTLIRGCSTNRALKCSLIRTPQPNQGLLEAHRAGPQQALLHAHHTQYMHPVICAHPCIQAPTTSGTAESTQSWSSKCAISCTSHPVGCINRFMHTAPNTRTLSNVTHIGERDRRLVCRVDRQGGGPQIQAGRWPTDTGTPVPPQGKSWVTHIGERDRRLVCRVDRQGGGPQIQVSGTAGLSAELTGREVAHRDGCTCTSVIGGGRGTKTGEQNCSLACQHDRQGCHPQGQVHLHKCNRGCKGDKDREVNRRDRNTCAGWKRK